MGFIFCRRRRFGIAGRDDVDGRIDRRAVVDVVVVVVLAEVVVDANGFDL
jgi:hypothetical protein